MKIKKEHLGRVRANKHFFNLGPVETTDTQGIEVQKNMKIKKEDLGRVRANKQYFNLAQLKQQTHRASRFRKI